MSAKVKTLKTAIKYSLIKWKYAMETGCNDSEIKDWLESNHKKIRDCVAECGLCDFYTGRCCTQCILSLGLPVPKERFICLHKKHPYKKWDNAKTEKKRIKYATIIYNAIKEHE